MGILRIPENETQTISFQRADTATENVSSWDPDMLHSINGSYSEMHVYDPEIFGLAI